jgi:hypothetical protein
MPEGFHVGDHLMEILGSAELVLWLGAEGNGVGAARRQNWRRRSSRRRSGSADLDQEALAMLTRAQPMPRPPDRVPTRELSFMVPIKFTIR